MKLWKWLAGLGAIAGAAYVMKDSVAPDPRTKVVEIAKGELGKGDSSKYWHDVAPSLENTNASWCGGFALWCLHQAGLALDTHWIVGKGFLGKLKQIDPKDAKPGDIAYFNKNQHHAIIVKGYGDGTTLDINGNGMGGVVTMGTKSSKPDMVFSIQGLIDKAAKS